jgi:hypothetical protein
VKEFEVAETQIIANFLQSFSLIVDRQGVPMVEHVIHEDSRRPGFRRFVANKVAVVNCPDELNVKFRSIDLEGFRFLSLNPPWSRVGRSILV